MGNCTSFLIVLWQNSVALLDTFLNGGQVAGSTPARSVTFFCGDLIMKYFLWSFSPFC